ncbi:MAG: GxxExxY protein [Phycisphaerales bacterium]|nr:GxxExxY protein [Phycisphaerales bacterium]
MDSDARRYDNDRRRDDDAGPRRRGVPLSDLDPALTEISRKVIGCAIEVHKELGPGYDKEVYANALMSELKREGVPFKRAHAFDVFFDDEKVGTTVADLFVNDRFIVDIMAFHGEVGGEPRTRVRAQLRAADIELALIINFGERRLKDGLVRVLNPDKIESLKHGDDDDGGHGEA